MTRQKEQEKQAEKQERRSNDSPEIPDRGLTSDITGLPLGPWQHKGTYLRLCARHHGVWVIASGVPPLQHVLVNTAIEHCRGVPLKENAVGWQHRHVANEGGARGWKHNINPLNKENYPHRDNINNTNMLLVFDSWQIHRNPGKSIFKVKQSS